MATIENTPAADDKIARMRELFADAPEVGKAALENVIGDLTKDSAEAPPNPVVSAGRVKANSTCPRAGGCRVGSSARSARSRPNSAANL